MRSMRLLNRFLEDRRRVQLLLLGAGILSVCLGVWREEVKTVLQKAITVCLECVGIG